MVVLWVVSAGKAREPTVTFTGWYVLTTVLIAKHPKQSANTAECPPKHAQLTTWPLRRLRLWWDCSRQAPSSRTLSALTSTFVRRHHHDPKLAFIPSHYHEDLPSASTPPSLSLAHSPSPSPAENTKPKGDSSRQRDNGTLQRPRKSPRRKKAARPYPTSNIWGKAAEKIQKG